MPNSAALALKGAEMIVVDAMLALHVHRPSRLTSRPESFAGAAARTSRSTDG